MKVFNGIRSLKLREEDTTFDLIETRTAPIVHERFSSPLSTEQITFLVNNQNEIVYTTSTKSIFRHFSLTFRTEKSVCTIVEMDPIRLIVDADGYLALLVVHHQPQRIPAKTQRRSVNDGHRHTIEIHLIGQSLYAWIDSNEKISIDLMQTALIIENFIFGAHNQFVGCIERVIFNDETFVFQQIPIDRQKCSLNILLEDQTIHFDDLTRPLIIFKRPAESIDEFSFRFSTFESNSFLCSLTNSNYEQMFLLTLTQQGLSLIYHSEFNRPIEFLLNSTTSFYHGNEHQLMMKFLKNNELVLQFDEQTMRRNNFNRFTIEKINFGHFDSLIGEGFGNNNRDNFLGCLRDVRLNGKSLVKLEDIYPISRLTDSCSMKRRQRMFHIQIICV